MDLLAHPFTVRANGTVATVPQGSDASNAQLLAALVLTRYGERELAPGFGTSDPVMNGIDPTEIAAQVTYWGPQVTIVDVTQTATDFETVAARIEFA